MNEANDVAADMLQVDALAVLDAPGSGDSGADLLGRVAAPPNKESTSDFFYFWVERGKLVERGQIVTTTTRLGGRTVEFIGLVEEVYRQSRQRDMGEEIDRFDATTSGASRRSRRQVSRTRKSSFCEPTR